MVRQPVIPRQWRYYTNPERLPRDSTRFSMCTFGLANHQSGAPKQVNQGTPCPLGKLKCTFQPHSDAGIRQNTKLPRGRRLECNCRPTDPNTVNRLRLWLVYFTAYSFRLNCIILPARWTHQPRHLDRKCNNCVASIKSCFVNLERTNSALTAFIRTPSSQTPCSSSEPHDT